MESYVAVPQSAPGPAVIVLQEWWGLVDHIKRVADRFADAGFLALAPDLYDGETADRPDEAQRLFMALNIEKTEATLAVAVTELLAHTACASTKVGVVGFCMGGQLALLAGTNPDVGAVVDFYGIHPKVEIDAARMQAPVLGLFGETDPSVPPAAAEALKAQLEGAGKSVTTHIYPGVGHAFFNDTRPDAYDADAAADAWQRTTAFFKENL